MNIEQKWSGELANGQWSSLQIGIDESDVNAWCFENQWDREKIPFRLLYLYMEAELQKLMSATLISRYPNATTSTKEELTAWILKAKEAKGKIDDFLAGL